MQQNENNGNSNEEEEMKPFYPKNDVWLYECQLKYWSKVQAKNKNPVFQPRFSQSCVTFQDQIIVFGGLRLMGDVLEDIFVLHLKDSDNYLQKVQREDMKNICKYCQMIYAVQGEEDIVLKASITNNDSIQGGRLSMNFLNSMVQLIEWPFACFGLLTDNAIMSRAKELKIRLEMRSRQERVEKMVEEER